MEENKKERSEMNERELLIELIEKQESRKKWEQIAAFSSVGLFVLFLVAALVLVPRIVRSVSSIDRAVSEAESAISGIETMSQKAEDALVGIDTFVQNADSMITENTEGVADALDHINAIDYEGLNQAIRDLADVVQPLAKFANMF